MPHALRLRTAGPAHRDLPEVAQLAVTHPAHATHPTRGLRAWWARNVVAMDPHPEVGTLDRLDAVATVDRFRPAPVDPGMQRVA